VDDECGLNEERYNRQRKQWGRTPCTGTERRGSRAL
jgi:hypothetical protein